MFTTAILLARIILTAQLCESEYEEAAHYCVDEVELTSYPTVDACIVDLIPYVCSGLRPTADDCKAAVGVAADRCGDEYGEGISSEGFAACVQAQVPFCEVPANIGDGGKEPPAGFLPEGPATKSAEYSLGWEIEHYRTASERIEAKERARRDIANR